jgi:predicted RNA binding protein YcfA (HicA-like mRNA interferase family)
MGLDRPSSRRCDWRGAMTVREVIRRLESEGWYRVKSKGSHRQFKHPTKPGRVTVSGKMSDTLAAGTLKSIRKQAGWTD